jgi:hypothetical protein
MSELSFPDDAPIFDFHVANIVFYGEAGLRRIRCVIDAKALQEHFGATGRAQAQLMSAFQRGLDEIHAAAERRYQALGPGQREIVLSSRDFATGSALERHLAKHLSLDSSRD